MARIGREGPAVWQGSGKEGKGTLDTRSGALRSRPYAFTARLGDGQGTNPEEPIAAAHAGCFSVALAFRLAGAGHPPEEAATTASLSMRQEAGGWRIAAVALQLRARAPGIGRARFAELGEAAKATCPASKFVDAEITLAATREG
jgi:osmotically inducible protein OsmC